MTRLSGRKLLLTRSAEDSADWSRALAAEGALPIVFPCIETEAIDDDSLKHGLEAAMQNADWIVFTSRRGVDAFAELFESGPPASARLTAVGVATAARIRERFGRVDFTGPGTAKALALALAEEPSILNGASCVLALAANAGDVLEKTLTRAGASVARFNLYRTRPAERIGPKRALSTLRCDTVIFASPTAVTGFDNQVNVDMAGLFVTIGPSTSAAVRARDWEVAAEAKEPSLPGIVESLLEAQHV